MILAHASWHSPRQFLATAWELARTMDHSQQALYIHTLILEAKRSTDRIHYLPGGLSAQVPADKCNLEL